MNDSGKGIFRQHMHNFLHRQESIKSSGLVNKKNKDKKLVTFDIEDQTKKLSSVGFNKSVTVKENERTMSLVDEMNFTL